MIKMPEKPLFAVIHYDEIGLKGGNRVHFEKMLQRNIKAKLGKLSVECRREPGQIAAEIEGGINNAKEILSAIPGIAYFSFARRCDLDMEDIVSEVILAVKDADFETFKIEAKRHNKRFHINSIKINEIAGEAVVNKFKK